MFISIPQLFWQNYRIKLTLNDEQKAIFEDISNAFRYCYNWGLAFCNNEYESGRKHPSFITMTSAFTEFRNNPENKWLLKYNVATCRYALANVRNAFEKFFQKHCRYPKFKSKKTAEKKLKVDGCKITFYGDQNEYIHIPGFGRRQVDLIKCSDHKIPVGPNVLYHNVYIRSDGDNYWLSLSVEMRNPFIMDEYVAPEEPIGIDIGIRTAATLSNGMEFEGPDSKRHKILDNRAKKVQAAIHRDQLRRKSIANRTRTKYENVPKTKNELKREAKFRKTKRDIHNLFMGKYHQISRAIANMNPSYVVLEGFDGRDLMIRDRHWNANDNAHAMMSTLRELIAYKCEQEGSRIIYADREFPSTQLCSQCGFKQKIGPSKIYKCPMCGTVIDRDLNAAINLRNYGESIVAQNGLFNV